jgi:hypothetical protein
MSYQIPLQQILPAELAFGPLISNHDHAEPLPRDHVVIAEFQNGTRLVDRVGSLVWEAIAAPYQAAQLIGYRAVTHRSTGKPYTSRRCLVRVTADGQTDIRHPTTIPGPRDTMTPHTSARRPVPSDAIVHAAITDGGHVTDRAGSLHWGPALAADGAGRITAYSVICPAARTAGAQSSA